MIMKYKTNYSNDGIEKVEVVRETAKMVVLPSDNRCGRGKERKQYKTSPDACYFDTWDAAHQYLMVKASQRIEASRVRLERARRTYEQIKGMKP